VAKGLSEGIITSQVKAPQGELPEKISECPCIYQKSDSWATYVMNLYTKFQFYRTCSLQQIGHISTFKIHLVL